MNKLRLVICGYLLHDLDVTQRVQPHARQVHLHAWLLALRVGLRIPAFSDPLARLDAQTGFVDLLDVGFVRDLNRLCHEVICGFRTRAI